MTSLVLLPGLDGTGTLHADFLEAARPHFGDVRVVSYPRDRKLDYPALEALAREALPHDRPFVLLGESFSGPVAIRIASEPPPNLVALVLSTTFARNPLPWTSPLTGLSRIAPVHSMPDAIAGAWLLGRWSTPKWRIALEAALASVEAAVLRDRMAVALRAEESHRLASIRVPTLCLRATRDRVIPRAAVVHMATKIPGAVSVDIDAPHFLLQAVPKEAVRMMADFLANKRSQTTL